MCSLLNALGTINADQNSEVKQAEIKGACLHQSPDDPSVDKPVISVRFKNDVTWE